MQDERLGPIWSLLDTASFNDLIAEPGRLPAAVRIKECDPVKAADVPLLGVADAILARARDQEGLRLTASGYLGLNEVKAIFEAMPWDEKDKDITRSVCRVIQEQDFTPLHLVRSLLQKAGLLRRRKDRLYCRKGAHHAAALLPEIVASTFWRIDLAEFDGVPFSNWPQDHVGVTLWAISACGLQWAGHRELMALTTLAHPALARAHGDHMLAAFQLRVLRPLVWLGHVEVEQPWKFSTRSERRARKSLRFDQVFEFAVRLRDHEAIQLH